MTVEQRLQPFGPADPKTERFRLRLEAQLQNAPPVETIDIPEMRRLRAAGEGVLPVAGPTADGRWRAWPDAVAGAPNRVRVVDPPSPPRGVYFHVHGGGWTFGAPELGDARAARLAAATGARVVSAAYRLAPEHPWPIGLEDCARALEVAIAEADALGGAPLVVGGDSAGAQLAVRLLLDLRDQGRIDRVCGAALAYGCFDLRLSPSARSWGARNLVLSTPIIDWFVGNLLPDRALAQDPKVSPLLADLAGAPPALFQVGDADPLLDDTLFMAERWRAAGAEARLRVWPGGFHAFDYFDDPSWDLPDARRFQDAVAQFVAERFDARPGRPG